MYKVHNSQLEKAGYTRKLPGVEDPTNDPHGEINTPAKLIIKKDSVKKEKKTGKRRMRTV